MELFSDYTFRVVALGSALMGVISGIFGCFAVLRKQSLLGDGVSHAALPGVVIAFMLTGSKNTEILLFGALVTGLTAAFCINKIVKLSRVKFDSALALIMSVFFGIGLVLLTYVQKIPDASQAGLKRFIYGQASTMMERDVILMSVCCVVMIIVVALIWKELKVFTFDREYANIIGFSSGKINIVLTLLIVIGIIIGLQTVGVVLMSAMLISPAVAARQWCDRLWLMVLLSAIFGAVSGIIGTAISSLSAQIPTGPAIVICISVIACFSLLAAPNRGILHRAYLRAKNKSQFKGGEKDVNLV